MIYRFTLFIILAALSSCANNSIILNNLSSSLGLISAYEASVEDYKQGRMMEARTRILTIERDHEDYKSARLFLKKKVNPARLKLLRYYARKGKKEEAMQHWSKAEQAYASASTLSIKPKALLRYQANMAFKVRQLREKIIYEQLKKEDMVWLTWLNAYIPPSGLAATDLAFEQAREDLHDAFETRADDIWSMAIHYEYINLPEMAWVYAGSYLRLKPDSDKASILKNTMVKAVPKGLKLGGFIKLKVNQAKGTKGNNKIVSKSQVTQLMQQGKWISARDNAYLLRRQGHSEADALLDDIEKKNAELGKKSFEDGNLAFRLEHIDRAVMFWAKAVKRMPHKQKYKDSLRRGKQIQERLHALKAEESKAEKDVIIEE